MLIETIRTKENTIDLIDLMKQGYTNKGMESFYTGIFINIGISDEEWLKMQNGHKRVAREIAWNKLTTVSSVFDSLSRLSIWLLDLRLVGLAGFTGAFFTRFMVLRGEANACVDVVFPNNLSLLLD